MTDYTTVESPEPLPKKTPRAYWVALVLFVLAGMAVQGWILARTYRGEWDAGSDEARRIPAQVWTDVAQIAPR